jgi:glycosyltransferase involved in cell wall biosynthesis
VEDLKVNIRRVLHVLRSVEGGVPVVVDHLVNGLDRERYEPIVLFDTHHQSEIRKKLLLSNIKTIDLKKCVDNQTSSSAKPLKNLNISRQLEANFNKEASKIYLSVKNLFKFLLKQAPMINSYVRAIRDNRVDLVHTHSDLYRGKPEIMASRISGIPCISHHHNYREFTYFDNFFSRFVDAFIYISNYVAEYHASQGARFKGTVIHNGIDLNRFSQSYDIDSVREEFGVKSDQTLLGIIGRIDWWKGHEYFIEAIAKAAKEIPGLRGLIVGSLEKNVIGILDRNRRYFKKLKLMVNSLGLSDKIIFTGSRNDVPRLVAAIDVVVHASSVPEPFGLVIIEGMAAGKPVVATGAGGVLDILEDGLNGLLVPCRDAEAMARAILQIISDPDRAKQMGMAARQCVTEKFTVQHQVMAVQKLYDNILANHQRKKRFRH